MLLNKDCNTLKEEVSSFSEYLHSKKYSYFEISEETKNELCKDKLNLIMNYLAINPLPNFNDKTSDIHSITIKLNFYSQHFNFLKPIELSEVIHYLEMNKFQIPINSYLKMYSEIFYSIEKTPNVVKKEYAKRINEAYIINKKGEIYRNYDKNLRINQMHRFIHPLLKTSKDNSFNTFRNNIFTRDNNEIQINYDSYEISDYGNTNEKILHIDNRSENNLNLTRYNNSSELKLFRSRERIIFVNDYLAVKTKGLDNDDEIRIDFLYDDPDYNNYNIRDKNNYYWIYRREIFKNISNYYSFSTLFLITVLIEMLVYYSYFMYRYFSITPKLIGEDIKTYGKKIRKYINELRYGNLEGELSPLQNLDQSIVESEKSVHLETSIKDLSTCKDNYEDYYDKTFLECFIWNLKMGILASRFDINRLYAPRFKLSISQFTFHIMLLLIIILIFNYNEYDASQELDIELIVKAWISSITLANLINMLMAQVLKAPKDTKEYLSNNPPKSDDELAECMSLNLSNIMIVHACQLVLLIILFFLLSYFLLGFTFVYKINESLVLAVFMLAILIDILIFDILWSMVIAIFVHGKRGEKPNILFQGMIEFTKLRSNA